MSHPVCERCGKEIVPGQLVTFIGMTEEELIEQRIILSDELVMAHADPSDCEPGS